MEGQEGLYIFFKTVCDDYNLIPEDNYTIPPEAEGIVTQQDTPQHEPESRAILKTPDKAEERSKSDEADATTTISTGATTRRHKHTPSLGSVVTTIMEGDEEDVKGHEHKIEPSPNHDQEPPVTPAPKAEEPKDEETVAGKGLDHKITVVDAQDKGADAGKEEVSHPVAEAEAAEPSEAAAKDVVGTEESKKGE